VVVLGVLTVVRKGVLVATYLEPTPHLAAWTVCAEGARLTPGTENVQHHADINFLQIGDSSGKPGSNLSEFSDTWTHSRLMGQIVIGRIMLPPTGERLSIAHAEQIKDSLLPSRTEAATNAPGP